MMADYTLEELLIARMSREFKGKRIGAGGTIIGDLSARLAKAVHEPELFLTTASRAAADCDVHPKSMSDEWLLSQTARINMDWQQLFHAIAQGRLQFWIGTVQIDRKGNSNISAIGPWDKPKAQLIGARGVPDDLWGCEKLDYSVRRHNRRSFVEKVDFVCGLGYGPERDMLSRKPAKPGVVVSDLGVFGFDAVTGNMRISSLHPGVSYDTVQQQTGFELPRPAGDIPVTAPPTELELKMLREVVDPLGFRRLESLDGSEQLTLELWREDAEKRGFVEASPR